MFPFTFYTNTCFGKWWKGVGWQTSSSSSKLVAFIHFTHICGVPVDIREWMHKHTLFNAQDVCHVILLHKRNTGYGDYFKCTYWMRNETQMVLKKSWDGSGSWRVKETLRIKEMTIRCAICGQTSPLLEFRWHWHKVKVP